jgi:hypothetical protein
MPENAVVFSLMAAVRTQQHYSHLRTTNPIIAVSDDMILKARNLLLQSRRRFWSLMTLDICVVPQKPDDE